MVRFQAKETGTVRKHYIMLGRVQRQYYSLEVLIVVNSYSAVQ